ncbi:homospermidine synthase [Bradyrhizobium sp. AZCC 2262]|uniref:hypothetical protein n=1 Tax=Bradyrhizobium sp. AZCC 2262 TaxID=3117022 RepID=UPI002FF2694E
MVGITLPKEYEGLFPRIVCGANPGGIGHQFVKATFIDGATPLKVYCDERRYSIQHHCGSNEFACA